MLTVRDVRCELVSIIPAFDEALLDEGSLFADADGAHTFHGLFAELSHYVREHIVDLDEPRRRRLFEFVEQCMISDASRDDGLSNAAATCFIENLTNDPVTAVLRPYMGHESGAHFEAWDRGGHDA